MTLTAQAVAFGQTLAITKLLIYSRLFTLIERFSCRNSATGKSREVG